MASRYFHKGSMTAGKVPAASDLSYREIYVNAVDGLAYTKTTADQIVTLNPPGETTYNNTTVFRPSQCATYIFNGTTDSSGRVVFNLTKDGTASGVAIFSAIFGRFAQAYSTSATSTNSAPFAVIEAFTPKTVTVRLVAGVTLLLLSNTTAFAGAGYRVDLLVTGSN